MLEAQSARTYRARQLRFGPLDRQMLSIAWQAIRLYGRSRGQALAQAGRSCRLSLSLPVGREHPGDSCCPGSRYDGLRLRAVR
jgi:hypothetical protein